MKKITPFLFIILAFLLCSCSQTGVFREKGKSGNTPLSENAPEIFITSVTATELKDADRITIRANKEIFCSSSTHYQPPSLVLTIPSSRFIDLPSEITVQQGNVQSIHLVHVPEPENISMIHIIMDRLATYTINKENHSLMIDIDRTELQPELQAKTVAPSAGTSADISKIDQSDYVIGGKDVLYITVYDEPELSYDPSTGRSIRVSIDGKISLPLLGIVEVSGLTAFQLEKKLARLFSEGYLINPHVSVIVGEYHSKEVFVLGAVHKPGVYPLLGNENTLEILSMAGGVITGEAGPLASNDLIIIRKKGLQSTSPADNNIEYIRLDLQKILREGDISLNIAIQDQDTLYIPMAESVFVFGEVKTPGAIKFLEKDITVIEAISIAGGLTPIAAPNRTRIVRMEDGVEKIIHVNVKRIIKGEKGRDVILKPGDIVMVPETFF
ncbi:MAG: polysaccharide export protein [Candidatus Brocadiaceae bacterium]|nr:polysaccharide export protein [Candidatus Brocadiaceae bacterium]